MVKRVRGVQIPQRLVPQAGVVGVLQSTLATEFWLVLLLQLLPDGWGRARIDAAVSELGSQLDYASRRKPARKGWRCERCYGGGQRSTCQREAVYCRFHGSRTVTGAVIE